MKFFFVSRDGDIMDEPFATEIGAKSFIRICKGIDKACKRKYVYEVHEGEGQLTQQEK